MMKRNLLLALALAVVAGAWAAGLGGVVTSPGGNHYNTCLQPIYCLEDYLYDKK